MSWRLHTALACFILLSLLAQGPQAAAKDKSPQKEITNSIGMKLVAIPAGTFRMGSPEGLITRDAGPVAELDRFELWRFA